MDAATLNQQTHEYHIQLGNMLFREAVKGDDGFRMWYYPHLPKHYEINPDLLVWCNMLLTEFGHTPETSYTHIMKHWRIRQSGKYCSPCMAKDGAPEV